MISDFTILALPIYSLWKLQMPIKRKAGVSMVFAIGIIGCGASIGRVVYGVRLLHAADQDFVIIQNGLFSVIEVNMIVVCTSLPLAPKLLQLIRHGRKGPSAAYPTLYKKQHSHPSTGPSSKPSNWHGVHSTPWDDPSTSESRLATNYIPLEGIDIGLGTSCNAYADRVSTVAKNAEEELDQHQFHNEGIIKTIRIERTMGKY